MENQRQETKLEKRKSSGKGQAKTFKGGKQQIMHFITYGCSHQHKSISIWSRKKMLFKNAAELLRAVVAYCGEPK